VLHQLRVVVAAYLAQRPRQAQQVPLQLRVSSAPQLPPLLVTSFPLGVIFA